MRVGIIEDEYLEREALTVLLKNAHQPIDIVFSANNGEDGISLYDELEPDLVLLDIQMPKKSGLAVLDHIQASKSRTVIIIITAYSSFEYAQQALNSGASSYLLKPYSKHKLYEAIDKAEKQLSETINSRDSEPALSSRIDKYFRTELFLYMVSGKYTDKMMGEFIAESFLARKYIFRCYVFLVENVELNVETQDAIVNAIEKRYPDVVCRTPNDIVCLCYQTLDSNWPVLHHMCDIIRNCIPKQGKITFVCSDSTEDLYELHELYRELRIQLLSDEMRSRRVLDLIGLEQRLGEAVLHCDWDAVNKVLSLIEVATCKINNYGHSAIRGYYSHLWRQIDRLLYHATGLRKTMGLKSSIDEQLSACTYVVDMTRLIFEYLRHYAESIGLVGRTVQNNAINLIKEYIDEHLSKRISLESVAGEVGFSTSYLSRLFKKVEGINFKDYLIKVRMERAKLLLSQGNMNVAEVADAVGYPNADYFSKSFHQYYGISPTGHKYKGKKGE